MAESNKYVRVYTSYPDSSYAGDDVFYKTRDIFKALEKFKEDFSPNAYITINAEESRGNLNEQDPGYSGGQSREEALGGAGI